jgi:hypothetical protein
VGVPLIVIVLAFHAAETPAGSPVGIPMPVAPVVAMVIGVSALFTHTVGFDDGVLAVFRPFTVITMLFEFTVAADTQAALLVMVQDTTSPLFNEDDV